MSKEDKEIVEKASPFEALRALYYSGKVKPTLNKIIVELENEPNQLDLILLACQCLLRGKDYEQLSAFADKALALDDESAAGYYFKGVALHHSKGKEQDALKMFKEAITRDPENVVYLKAKAETHLALFKDYHLPMQIADKQRIKGEECLNQVVAIVEAKENPTYLEYLTIADVSITINKNIDAKMYYIKAVDAFNAAEKEDQNNIVMKDIIKAQNACNRLMQKFTE